jgi:hypothetical protein
LILLRDAGELALPYEQEDGDTYQVQSGYCFIDWIFCGYSSYWNEDLSIEMTIGPRFTVSAEAQLELVCRGPDSQVPGPYQVIPVPNAGRRFMRQLRSSLIHI